MKLRFGHLADYAAVGERGKIMVIGIFENVLLERNREPNRGSAVLCRGVVPSAYRGRIGPLNSSRRSESTNRRVTSRASGPLRFIAAGPGRPAFANLITELQGLPVPGLGEYRFEFLATATERYLGFVPLSILAAPTAAPPQ